MLEPLDYRANRFAGNIDKMIRALGLLIRFSYHGLHRFYLKSGFKVNCIIISASGTKTFTQEQLRRLNNTADVHFHAQPDSIDTDKFVSLVKEFDYVGLTRRPLKNLDQDLLSQLPCLKGLAIYSTGYEWVDTAYLKGKGIVLSYLPDYSTITVAEHTIGMLLSLSRRFQLSNDYACQRIDRSISLRGFELYGKTVGIIGYGRIGKRVAELLKPFGVTLLWYDIEKKSDDDLCYSSFDTLIQKADIIIITASKKRDAEPVIGYNEISSMKHGVVIVNSSRADLVDNNAMVSALISKKVFSYAVDDIVPALKNENIEPGRVFETSHTAWYSTEAIARGTQMWVDNIIGLLQGKPVNVVGRI